VVPRVRMAQRAGRVQQALRLGSRQACSSSSRRLVLISLRSSAEIRCTCRSKVESGVEALSSGQFSHLSPCAPPQRRSTRGRQQRRAAAA
jgi:hypothetical protein